jgi:hypothetical protein
MLSAQANKETFAKSFAVFLIVCGNKLFFVCLASGRGSESGEIAFLFAFCVCLTINFILIIICAEEFVRTTASNRTFLAPEDKGVQPCRCGFCWERIFGGA